MVSARAACTWGSGGRPPVSQILGAPKRANARFSSKVEESAKNGHVRGAINLRFFQWSKLFLVTITATMQHWPGVRPVAMRTHAPLKVVSTWYRAGHELLFFKKVSSFTLCKGGSKGVFALKPAPG
jgi:hypothetical protein